MAKKKNVTEETPLEEMVETGIEEQIEKQLLDNESKVAIYKEIQKV